MNRYEVYVTPETFQAIKGLPGNVRQQVRQAIKDLEDSPRPAQSKRLDLPEFKVELWRIRLGKWRILYAIDESEKIIDVLAVRKRPPYDYGDLEQLIHKIR